MKLQPYIANQLPTMSIGHVLTTGHAMKNAAASERKLSAKRVAIVTEIVCFRFFAITFLMYSYIGENRYFGCLCKGACDTRCCPCYAAHRECSAGRCRCAGKRHYLKSAIGPKLAAVDCGLRCKNASIQLMSGKVRLLKFPYHRKLNEIRNCTWAFRTWPAGVYFLVNQPRRTSLLQNTKEKYDICSMYPLKY